MKISALTIQDLEDLKGSVTPLNDVDIHAFNTGQPLVNIAWNIISVCFVIAVYGFLIAVVYSGLQYLSAGANDEALVKAKKTFTNATIGLVVVFASYQVLIMLIGQFAPVLGPGFNLAQTIGRAYNIVLAISGAIFLLYRLVAGFRYITSAGSEEAAGKAIKELTNSFYGIFLIVFAYAIGRLILSLFGIL